MSAVYKIPYEKSFASHPKAEFWHPTMNGTVVARGVFKSSGKKYWFKCVVCKHDFESALSKITCSNRWCSYCANKKLCNDEKCKICKHRSFASHPKAKYWHPSMNGTVVPREVFKSTHTKYWFICNTCNHSFDHMLYHIKRGIWCPYCGKKQLCNDDKCKICKHHSFASHPKAKYWHPTKNKNSKNKDVVPREVFKSSNTKYWFKCNTCNHEFESQLNNISKGNWCPYCAKTNGKLCDDKECSHCLNRSFASHPKAEFWHPTKNKDIVPREVFKTTAIKYWFKCDTCKHDFKSTLNNISCLGQWCPHCLNKTEKKMKEHLEREKETLHIKTIEHHYRPDWTRVHGTYYEYDFYIELTNGVKIIIEVDGRQHYKQVRNWGNPIHNQIRDCIKERLAGQQKINLIRLNQDHIWKDKENWVQELQEFIQRKYENNREIKIYDACCW